MFTKAEVKKLEKGFTASRTHESGNRKSRRQSNYGLHNLKKGPVMVVQGNPPRRFKMFIQKVKSAKGITLIEHCIPV